MDKRAKQRFFLNQGTLDRKVLSADFGRPVVYGFVDVSNCSPDASSLSSSLSVYSAPCGA
jgi:hypothetical protein